MFLYDLIIRPIETLVEWTFILFRIKLPGIGIIGAIFGVSMVVNFLALPLYNIADRLQEKERRISKGLEYRVRRIKKAFKGDEQFMMLQTYYRQNNYHPLYVLRSSLSILIEVPFFIAAYHYLSHCQELAGQSFWIFSDLGQPDHLIGPINILPILMTLINYVSSAVYLKDANFKEKFQLYGIAILFLFLLYDAPSGLVIYWILNNLFSLGKNIIIKMKHSRQIALMIIAAGLVAVTAMVWIERPNTALWKKMMLTGGVAGIIVVPYLFIKLGFCRIFRFFKEMEDTGIFFLSALALALFLGLVLPARLIATSPQEFSFLGETASPLTYVWSSFWYFMGLALMWPFAINRMFGKEVRTGLTVLFFVLLICSLANAFIFKSDYGNLSVMFVLDDPEDIARLGIWFLVLPWVVGILSVALLYFIKHKNLQKYCTMMLFALCLAEVVFGGYKMSSIKQEYERYSQVVEKKTYNSDTIEPEFHLSKTKDNVVVLFLDRAISSFFPHFIEQFPELKDQYEGFTFYPNCVSFGTSTVYGAPPMLAGYEYTHEGINARKDELLLEKHNESLMVMPRLFSEAGFDVTFANPPFVNYKWSGDLSPFEKYPAMNVFEDAGKYLHIYDKDDKIKQNKNVDKTCRHKIVFFSMLQTMYPRLRQFFYEAIINTANAYLHPFLDSYSTLYFLSELTAFDSMDANLVIIENETPHNRCYLNYPDYDAPSDKDDRTIGTYKVNSEKEFMDYNTNMAAIKAVGKFLDYLRKNGVYDNTRIIIVSDHGYDRHYSRFDHFGDKSHVPSNFNCLFMYKDFNSKKPLATDSTFMTNADTLFLAKEGLPISDVNPFTGKVLKQEKEKVRVWMGGPEWNAPDAVDKKQFADTECWEVKDDIFNPANWKRVK